MALTKRFQDSTLRLIRHFGATRTYRRIVGEDYDPNDQVKTYNEELYDVKVFKTDPKERETKSPNLVNKETAVMLIAAKSLPFRPRVGDTITETYLDSDETFMIEVIKENWAGEDIASWRLICSKA